MSLDAQILQKLEHLTLEVAQLKTTINAQNRADVHPPPTTAPQEISLQPAREAPQELMEQLAFSGANMTKWVKTLDQLMELKEDLVPLSKPMLEEVIQALDQATHGFDADALKALIKQFSLNLSNLSQAIKMVGGLVELQSDSAQIAKDAFEDAIVRLEALKQKGFFDSMRQILEILELVGQKMLVLDTTQVKPVRGLLGLHAAMKQKEFQQGLGIMVEMISVLSVLKK